MSKVKQLVYRWKAYWIFYLETFADQFEGDIDGDECTSATNACATVNQDWTSSMSDVHQPDELNLTTMSQLMI